MVHRKFDELRLTGALPSPSAIGLHILELTRDDSFDQEDLVRSIQADPALSGRIIKIANAADRDGLPAVDTVHQAAMRLGARAVRTVALGFTLVADNRHGKAEHFDYDGYWARALATGVAAHLLAQLERRVDPASAFTCGLLCDVGKLAFASVHPERYSELLRKHARTSDADLAGVEQRAFGIDHFEITAAMMADWGLPREFQEVAVLRADECWVRERAGDDDNDDLDPHSMLGVVQAARLIARTLVGPWRIEDAEWRGAFLALEHLARELEMSHEALLALCDAVLPTWREWGRLIGVPTECATTFHETAAEFARQGLDSDAAARAPEERTAPPVESAGEADTGLFGPELDLPLDSLGREAAAADATRILLVDDDTQMLRLIGHHLRREGYEVLTAESSHEGMRLALERMPQIVITDWMMPELSGVQLCETLRRSQAGSKMYFVLVTARDNDDQIVEAFEAGADDYIVKPFNPRILLARVRAAQRMIRLREKVEEAERARLRQVAELGVMTRRLRSAALTDALTTLPNRRYAMKRLKQEWESAMRTGRPLSVVMCDIDHFKRVNDEYGHDAGDVVLREIASALQSHGRASDVLCRLGGEEFLVINAATDAATSATAAERLRVAIACHRIRHEDFDQAVTMSFGVAQRSEGMKGVDDLIKAADEALYAAKEAGRNRVFVATGPAGDGAVRLPA